MTFVGVKMPQSMVDALDHVAKMRDETRSDVIRLFGENLNVILKFLGESEHVPLDGNVSEWFKDQLPSNTSPAVLIWLRNIVNEAIEAKLEEVKNNRE